MVTTSARHACWLIDIGGAAVVGICVAVFLWLAFIREDRAGAALLDLSRSVRAAEADLLRLRALSEDQRALLSDEKAKLAVYGTLPLEPPVESYFEALAAMALRADVQLRSQAPLPPRLYPTLAEYRFVCELSGTLPNLSRFFDAIEKADFWADVSHLKIESAKGSESVDSDDRVAQITLSLFTAPPAPGQKRG